MSSDFFILYIFCHPELAEGALVTFRQAQCDNYYFLLKTKSNASKIALFAFSSSIFVCAAETKPTS